jgi:hypothetical protein
MPNTPLPNNEMPDNPNETLVNDILVNHKCLQHLKGKLVACVASLDYDILKELAAKAAITILADYNNIRLYNDKISKTKPTTAPYPRSIRLNIKLTCSEKETRETTDYTNLRKEADLLTKGYQQKMRQLIVKIMEFDKGTVAKKLQENFFKFTALMIEKKVLYESMILPENSVFVAAFKNHGETKTMAGYFCIKLLEAAKTDTSDILYYYLEKTVELLGLPKEDIVEGILSRFNKTEAQAIVQNGNYQNNAQEVNIKVHVQRVLLFLMNAVSFELIKGYKEDVRQRNALAVTEATFEAKDHTEAAEAVETALSDEGTISAQRMEDLLEKKVDKKLKKSLELSDIEGRFEALQQSIEKLAKNSEASRNDKKPASAKKRKQNNKTNQKKKKKKVIEIMNDSSSESDTESSDSDDDSGNSSDSSEEITNEMKTPKRKLKFKQSSKKGQNNNSKKKKKKSKNMSWHRSQNKSNKKGKGNQGDSPKGKGKKGKK